MPCQQYTAHLFPSPHQDLMTAVSQGRLPPCSPHSSINKSCLPAFPGVSHFVSGSHSRAEMLQSICPLPTPSASNATVGTCQVPWLSLGAITLRWEGGGFEILYLSPWFSIWLHIWITWGALRTIHTKMSPQVNQLDLRRGGPKHQLSRWFSWVAKVKTKQNKTNKTKTNKQKS